MATEIDFKDNHEIPKESKRAMTTAALFTNIFQKYLEQNRCEYVDDEEELGQFSAELLDHVIIVGGFCRDILLNRAVNDIDIVINLRELTKLQTNHLKKYHSKSNEQDINCRCVYWQRYLNKRNVEEAFTEAQSRLPELEMMHNLNYILNANFWLGILRDDKSLENKLSVKDFPRNGYHSARIVNSITYGDIDCDGQNIDIIDTFHVDKALQHDETDQKLVEVFHRKSRQLSVSGLDISRVDLGQNKSRDEVPAQTKGGSDSDSGGIEMSAGDVGGGGGRRKHGRLASMAMIDVKIDEMGSAFGAFGNKSRDEQQYIAIEVPIYSGKVRYKLLNYDFSINTCILPLSNIIKLKEYNNEEAEDCMTWIEIVENGLGECDGIEDCTQEKILRSPEHDHCSILAHPQGYVFWRIVRWKIAQPDFSVDDGLVAAQQEDFTKWLTTDWFNQVENRHKFMTFLQRTLEKNCTNINDVKQMLSVMAELKFTPLFAQVAQQSPVVRRKLTECIRDCRNGNLARNEIREAFGEHALALVTDDELEMGGNSESREQELEHALYDAKRETARIQETLDGTLMQLKRAKDEINALKGKEREEVNRLRKELSECKEALEEAEEEKEQENNQVIQLTNQASRLMTEAKEGKALKREELPKLRKEMSELKEAHEMLKERKQQLAVSSAETINELRDYLRQYQNIIAAKISEKERKAAERQEM